MPHTSQVVLTQKGRPGGEAGMTLLEIMIATGVILIAFLLAMGSVVSISATSALSEDQARAAAEASSVMDELRTMPFEELAVYQPPTAPGLPAGTGIRVLCFDSSGAPHTLPLAATTSASSFPNPVEVQVTVFWQDKTGRGFSARTSAMLGR